MFQKKTVLRVWIVFLYKILFYGTTQHKKKKNKFNLKKLFTHFC